MSVPRRFNRPQGLANIDVLIEDDAPISLYFNVVEVPEVITQGKSSFLIGGSNLLKPQTEIKFEITNDNTGAVIYTEPVPNYLEGTSRSVSIEVYEDVDSWWCSDKIQKARKLFCEKSWFGQSCFMRLLEKGPLMLIVANCAVTEVKNTLSSGHSVCIQSSNLLITLAALPVVVVIT